MLTTVLRGALGAAALGLATTALAHATLETGEARPGSSYRGVVRIPHGCDGSATRAVRLEIPESLGQVKPMPKAGWTLTTVKVPLATPFDDHGKPVTERVGSVVWSGGLLADEHYDEFVFRGRVADDAAVGSVLHVPIIQECERGEVRWTETPQPGQDARALKHPAPGLRIVAEPATSTLIVFGAGAIAVEAPWSRATPGGAKVAAGYMRIVNNGREPDRLIGGSVAVAGRFEVHEMSVTDGVMRMRPVEGGLVIPAGGFVELKPGGYHAMLVDLREPLKAGQTIRGTLTFEKAGTVAIEYRVGPIGGPAPAPGGHSHH